jgi:predicted lipoprotein with Yx(FWY)xxD motif
VVKIKRTQRGFAFTETVLILVIVGLIAFVAWYAFRTKSDTDSSLDLAGSSQIAPPQNNDNSKPQAQAKAQVVSTKTDSNGVSNCSGSCLTNWPIYEATATTDLPANVTVITRSDGKKQYAYKGMPLYYFSGDTSAGQVTGDGVNNFHVAKP